jgi:hypothetical protein
MAKNDKIHEEIIFTLKAAADAYIVEELEKKSSRISDPVSLESIKKEDSLVSITAVNLVKTMTLWNPSLKKVKGYNVDQDVLITSNPTSTTTLTLTMSDEKDDTIVKNFYGGEVEIGDDNYTLKGNPRIDVSDEFVEDISNAMLKSLRDKLAKEVIKKNRKNRDKRRKT